MARAAMFNNNTCRNQDRLQLFSICLNFVSFLFPHGRIFLRQLLSILGKPPKRYGHRFVGRYVGKSRLLSSGQRITGGQVTTMTMRAGAAFRDGDIRGSNSAQEQMRRLIVGET